jgi:hypothetical protein
VQSQTRIDTIFSNLKSGGIFVRLKTNENTLKALKGKNDQLAEKIIRERNKENQEIIEAFKVFTYCPIYFFYSSNSKKVINREFENVLLDFNLNPIPDTLKLNENYLIATFDYTSKDTSSYFVGSEYRYVSTEIDGQYKGERKRVDVYGSPSAFDSGVSGLVFLSPELVPIKHVNDIPVNIINYITGEDKPTCIDFTILGSGGLYISAYPSYVRTFEGLPFERTKQKTIEKLQYKMEMIGKKYYKYYSYPSLNMNPHVGYPIK